ncbi:adenosylcobinamide-phosphate synthase CbiB [Clostridium chauvoei]|uniref:Cobalamin biosynthesis protein CobD n=2 Tax=Clostridium chauvoei TaxID=46867 RepID=S6ELY6_9CLOT|nr:adenosylcobinamide-phosphate synthase CbiB [Clostridium chauvoei]ATD55517.1 adenosylcobinamide-phosphate synthase [Clostridium chauvoei]ATD56807.1 adenosylcobinamide-phosphate synthase [Clostridium chauvoei]MBX7281204.1 adenosylcobinamide-phosphate synthase CbiB [Clostridium chauvoei]MBX7283686.1 adenosylcobinamide-phosphate synthase CbiB [Clostridium chauvoei]MBX7286294.1 adenosylcobinamide-phosphate synthase CbiB [Clostridium chauvoei]
MIDLTIGFILDLIIGDPENPIHPVRIMGSLCKVLENFFRNVMKKSLKLGGFITWIIVVLVVYFVSHDILKVAMEINNILSIILSSILIYFCISTKGLKIEGLKVASYLIKDDIEGARKQLSYIVGRDTKSLDKEGITRAVVETIAENMSDGVIAPLFYVGIGGAPLAMAYKAVNTMDSMFGYKNEKYKDFGFFPAKLDDVFNYIPARLTGIFTIIIAFILKLNWRNSFKIYNRDKNNHTSPNSAHPEAAVAGALGVRLGGANYYFGKLVEKPTIGDNLKEVVLEDIYITNKILYGVAILGYILAILIMLIWRLL